MEWFDATEKIKSVKFRRCGVVKELVPSAAGFGPQVAEPGRHVIVNDPKGGMLVLLVRDFVMRYAFDKMPDEAAMQHVGVDPANEEIVVTVKVDAAEVEDGVFVPVITTDPTMEELEKLEENLASEEKAE